MQCKQVTMMVTEQTASDFTTQLPKSYGTVVMISVIVFGDGTRDRMEVQFAKVPK